MKILEHLNLSDYGVNHSEFFVEGSSLIITKKKWDYTQCLSLQEKLVELVFENKSESAFIFCSHPTCLTMGRGLQRADDLVEFDDALRGNLQVPLFDISRGGGLTFHHEEQFIFYPIISLEFHKMKVLDFMFEILGALKNFLEMEFKILDLEHKNKLLGLWYKNLKLASIGLCTRRFVTFHGLALNLSIPNEVREGLRRLHPCGLPFDTYTGLEEIGAHRSSNFDLLRKHMLAFAKERNFI